eukprot:4956070-Lingulodinium_polyedra.AAC.1
MGVLSTWQSGQSLPLYQRPRAHGAPHPRGQRSRKPCWQDLAIRTPCSSIRQTGHLTTIVALRMAS